MSTGSVADSRGWHECDLVERAKQIASGSVLELACASRCRDYAVSDIERSSAGRFRGSHFRQVTDENVIMKEISFNHCRGTIHNLVGVCHASKRFDRG